MVNIKVLQKITKQKIIPVLRTKNADDAIIISKILKKYNFNTIELTFTIPEVEKAIKILKKEKLTIGVGSIYNKKQMNIAIKAKADFFVSPHYDIKLIKYAKTKKLFYIPGTSTLSEIMQCYNSGCKVIKVFPSTLLGGAKFIKSILAPLPFLKLFPTGGITKDNILDYFDSGAIAVGVGDITKYDKLNKTSLKQIEKKSILYASLIKKNK